MAKVKPYEIDKNKKREAIGDLIEAIERLKNKNETVNFLFGLLTPSEILMIARRIQIANLLIEDKSYYEIMKELKASSHNIQRVDRWLNNCDEKTSLRLKLIVKKKWKKKETADYSYKSLLNRYPAHRFWAELFGE